MCELRFWMLQEHVLCTTCTGNHNNPNVCGEGHSSKNLQQTAMSRKGDNELTNRQIPYGVHSILNVGHIPYTDRFSYIAALAV